MATLKNHTAFGVRKLKASVDFEVRLTRAPGLLHGSRPAQGRYESEQVRDRPEQVHRRLDRHHGQPDDRGEDLAESTAGLRTRPKLDEAAVAVNHQDQRELAVHGGDPHTFKQGTSRFSLERGEVHIQTDLEQDQLLDQLRQWEPWRHEINFSNGVKTNSPWVKTIEPYTNRPIKFWLWEPLIPAEAIRGGKALDVGSYDGCQSLLLRSKYDMEVTGIEVFEQWRDAAEFLRDQAQLDKISFELGDATFHRRPKYYDLVLHSGTLYHMRHPFLSLENSAASLRPGGFLALETLTLHSEALRSEGDGTLCRFFPRDYIGDPTNWWAFGLQAVCGMLEACGLSEVRVVTELGFTGLGSEKLGGTAEMSRTTFLARKPA